MQLTRSRSALNGFPIPSPCAAAPLTFLCINPGLFKELVELRFIRKESKNRIILLSSYLIFLNATAKWLFADHVEVDYLRVFWPHKADLALFFK